MIINTLNEIKPILKFDPNNWTPHWDDKDNRISVELPFDAIYSQECISETIHAAQRLLINLGSPVDIRFIGMDVKWDKHMLIMRFQKI